MTWTAAIIPVAAAIGLLIVPGLIVALCLRIRGYSALALSPLFSTSAVGVSAIVGGWLGVPWNLAVLMTGSVIVALITAFLYTFIHKGERAPEVSFTMSVGGLTTGIAVVFGAVLIGWRLMQLFQAPENISQRFDNVFHLNAIRYIMETGNASTLTLGEMSGATGLSALYPSAWHSFVALICQVSGASIPVAVNSFNIAAAALVWPLGCVMLVRQVVGPNPIAVLAAGVLSAAQVSAPYLLLVWGPLYPNAFSLDLMPAVLAVVVRLAGLGVERRQVIADYVSIVFALPGLATSHTSSLNALVAFTFPILAFSFVRKVRRLMAQGSSFRKIMSSAVMTLVILAAEVLIWVKVRPGFYDHWGPHQSEGGALGEAITGSPFGTPVAWVVTLLVTAGIVSSFSRTVWRWVPFSYGASVALYVIDAAEPRGAVRAFFTGIWYQDTYRLAAYLPIFATLLAAIGVAAAASNVSLLMRSGRPFLRKSASVQPAVKLLGSVAFAVLLAAMTQFGSVRQYIGESKVFYNLDDSSPILTRDELALLQRIDSVVPPGAVIADNPWNGSSLAYAVSGRKVLVYHLFADLTASQKLINSKLGSGLSDPEVCPAVKETHVQFVLDFGDHYLAPSDASLDFPGVTNVIDTPMLKLIDHEGSAKLYKVVGC